MDELDKSIIRCIQTELPITQKPYQFIADQLEIDETELLKRIEIMLEKGIIRRIGAVLNHRNVGFQANAMVVWAIPEDQVQESGKKLILHSEISHCYQRKVCPNWPYNVYTMIHARTKEECETVIKKVANSIEVYDYEVLYSTTELKKTSFLYFE
ncbi:Lrp/AsnC family transcriptional regulator [Clostridium aminobutyricum]|uniref:siroheme decarboxylase subunit beta n=1 Tax=Clostridium aminobutyricum TaxID=33953 RepID=UPI00314562EC